MSDKKRKGSDYDVSESDERYYNNKRETDNWFKTHKLLVFGAFIILLIMISVFAFGDINRNRHQNTAPPTVSPPPSVEPTASKISSPAKYSVLGYINGNLEFDVCYRSFSSN